MKNLFLLPAGLLTLAALTGQAGTLRVPGQYATIQAAINASANGDTILVAPGTYFENIRLKGKQVVLTSRYALSGNVADIRNTIINGSQPSHPDTASVVRITNGETAGTVINGFTLTGGTGTRWPDAHVGGRFREGGAVLCEGSSPVISNNLIINNRAVSKTGVVSAGGGAIRADGGQPRILNNVIMNNEGLYGAGIVLNYSGGIIRNNVICQNKGGQEFGGSGIWMLRSGPFPKIIENNTIVGNQSLLPGGGIRIDSTTAIVRNNIIWGNTAATGAQVTTLNGGYVTATYNDVEGGYAGTGNISLHPLLADSGCYLLPGSPCIDAGDPDPGYNDQAQTGNPAQAEYPSMGTVRNDIGAYGGGRRSMLFPAFAAPSLYTVSLVNFGLQPPGTYSRYVRVQNAGTAPLEIDSIRLRKKNVGFSLSGSVGSLGVLRYDSVEVTWLQQATGAAVDTMLIYHRDPAQPNPRKVTVRGLGLVGVAEDAAAAQLWLRLLGANPVQQDFLPLEYHLPQAARVQLSVRNVLGQEVARQEAGPQQPGAHQVRLMTGQLAAGTYVVTVTAAQAGAEIVQKQLLIMRR